jgi:hypothetical protein
MMNAHFTAVPACDMETDIDRLAWDQAIHPRTRDRRRSSGDAGPAGLGTETRPARHPPKKGGLLNYGQAGKK